jgi:hypothetical protein
MSHSIFALIALYVASRTSLKVSVPAQFRAQDTGMQVKGLKGRMLNQQVSVRPYQISKTNKGWHYRATAQYPKFRIRPEEYTRKVFEINTDNTAKHLVRKR